MSFGGPSANAIRALNLGAKLGGFAHDTGEGGLASYHLENGGDLVWEIGSGYFGCRAPDGRFDPEVFRDPEFLGICKAMIELNVYPDFIIIDGGEGGTGAAPLEFENHVGVPLTEGLIFAHNALVGCNLRDKIKIGCGSEIVSSFDMAMRMVLGADYCNAARAMMFALGCVQSQKCQTNRCPTGVATQDPRRSRAIVVPTKAERVQQFQKQTTKSYNQLIAAMGLNNPSELRPSMLIRRIDERRVLPYDEFMTFLEPGELLDGTDEPRYRKFWEEASPNTFRPG